MGKLLVKIKYSCLHERYVTHKMDYFNKITLDICESESVLN